MHKILLVEDDNGIRIFLKREFKKNPLSADWKIIEAGDGVEALNIINNENIRLVITDIVMPNMGGLELIDLIKKDDEYRDLPIIVLSNVEKVETNLLESGAVDFYSKPIKDYKPLITKVKTHIEAYLRVINLKRTVSFSQLNHNLENIKETMQQCLTDFCYQIRADMGALIVSADDAKLVHYANYNLTKPLREKLSAFLLDSGDKLNVKLSEIDKGLSVPSIEKYETDYPDHIFLARQHGIRSMLVLPLERDKVKTGLLFFFFRKKCSHDARGISSLTTSISEMAYAMANANQLTLLKERVHSMWKESHIPFTELKLPFPDCEPYEGCEACKDDSKQCEEHGNFQIDSPQDIIALTRALLKRVEYYMLAEKSRGDELESIVSERTKKLEEEKLKALSAARKKSEFIASMSHELRSPLNSIIGFSERIPPRIEKIGDNLNGLVSYIDSLSIENGTNGVMETIDSIRTKDIKKIKEFCGYIRSSGSHLLNLINDILDLSKIEADKMHLFFETIDFRPNLESVTASYRNVVEEKNLQISCEINDVSPFIYVDKIRFDQILFNLVGNAIKFSSPGGAVKISARELPSENIIEFCVFDNGDGIPDEFRQYVFNRFERADHSGVKSGIGLGLAIAKKLVEHMGGQIWFESKLGQGSSFYFTVPTEQVCEVR